MNPDSFCRTSQIMVRILKTIPILFKAHNLIVVQKSSGKMVYEISGNYVKMMCLLSRLEAILDRAFFPIHWLYRPVSGNLLMATSSKVAGKLAKVRLTDAVTEFLDVGPRKGDVDVFNRVF